MLLKELKEGQRFEFVDKRTALRLPDSPYFKYIIGAGGTYKYLGVRQGCPVLHVEQNGAQVAIEPGNFQRSVTVLF
jgi:hypothetical protein